MNRPEPPATTNRAHKRRCVAIALVAFSSALALAACGGSSMPNGASTSASSKPSSKQSYSASAEASGLAFSECMRAHRVPNFPDPSAGGGFQVNVSGYHASVSIGDIPGINQRSPAFVAANAACHNLLPGGAPAPGQQHPIAAAVAQARTWGTCMRAHGVPNFPDPGTFMPSSPPANTTLLRVNGEVFLIPGSIDLQAPAVKHAATACNFSILIPPGG